MSKDARTTGVSLIARRQFLAVGSAVVAGAFATDLAGQIARAVQDAILPAPSLSLGYIGSKLEDFEAADFKGRMLKAAERLTSSDAALAESVRLKVHGLVRPDEASIATVNLDVLFRVGGERGREVPFHAWTFSRTRGRVSTSSAAGFAVPVGPTQPVVLSVSCGSRSASTRATTMLCSGSVRQTNKLRRGLYFLALTTPEEQTPNWSLIRAVPSSDAKLPVLQEAVGIGYQPVRFPYVVFSADVVPADLA